MRAEERLRELRLELPEAVAPAFQYLSVVLHGGLAWFSGQVPRAGSRILMTGKVGAEVSLDQAQAAARACVLQALSQLKQALPCRILRAPRGHVRSASPRRAAGYWGLPRTAHARAMSGMEPSSAKGNPARMRSRSSARRSALSANT